MCSASFFAPYKRNVEPFIRIATGDYVALKAKSGRNNALASILCSLAHEIVHYQQWCNKRKLDEKEARQKANQIIKSYSTVVLRP
jgi:hypothetical protein